MKLFYVIPILCCALNLSGQEAQGTKIMDEDVYLLWNRIKDPQISADGSQLAYKLAPEKGDPRVVLYNTTEKKSNTFDRSHSHQITDKGDFLIFKTSHPFDSLQLLKRKKTKKKDLPKDTLSIYNISANNWTKISEVKKHKLPSKWNTHIAYQLEEQKPEKIDTTQKIKKESDKNGTKLIIRNLKTEKEDTLGYVTDFIHSEEGGLFAAAATGKDENDEGGVYIYDIQLGKWQSILKGKAKVKQLNFDPKGEQLAFLIDRDTTEVEDRPYELFHWSKDTPAALPLNPSKSPFKDGPGHISADRNLFFSDNGKQLFFGLKYPAIVQDTSLLDDEIVNVEVWSYTDTRLFPHQEKQLKSDKKKAYLVTYNTDSKSYQHLQDPEIDRTRLTRDANAKQILGIVENKYSKYISWTGSPLRDVYTIDIQTGKRSKIADKITGSPRLSPNGNYAYWYSNPDSSWVSYHLPSKKMIVLADNNLGKFYDETNDRPMHPWSNGHEGWSKDDRYVYIYDHFDIWKIDPLNKSNTQRLTRGREKKLRYRLIDLDREQHYLDADQNFFLSVFDEKDKSSGYSILDPITNKIKVICKEDYLYSGRVNKARDANVLFTTRENFQVFPDLIISRDSFKTVQIASEANPQQAEYAWGDAQLMEWTSLDGTKLEGLLITPPDFDPKKKYPLLVNFYERSSQNLNRHRAPFPGRSTISYAYYANKGYVIFNPDVIYTNGKPGESCYNSVISGVEAVVKKGFIDKDRIGVQGHSWGGYQIAHLVTKTDIFKCAESGAPVVNMISAYGGIRWRSGLSRMFQYEKTQSRLGTTLWEDPTPYIENSPIFNIDKINTPVLILHNDKDGAVPWYQGIEFFVAMRRLNKPAWLLNYNDEPHWPLKLQNRLDFNKRMNQFFDHYLMDAPKPRWMEEGVSAMNKGINQGLELIEK